MCAAVGSKTNRVQVNWFWPGRRAVCSWLQSGSCAVSRCLEQQQLLRERERKRDAGGASAGRG